MLQNLPRFKQRSRARILLGYVMGLSKAKVEASICAGTAGRGKTPLPCERPSLNWSPPLPLPKAEVSLLDRLSEEEENLFVSLFPK